MRKWGSKEEASKFDSLIMIEDAAGETEVGAREGKAVNATTVKPFFTEKKSFEGKIVTITRKPRPLLSFCRNFCAKLFPESHIQR